MKGILFLSESTEDIISYFSRVKKKRPFLIGVTGGSGSGKTSFIHALRNRYTTDEVCIISQDDFYRPLHEQTNDDKGIVNYDLPEAIDLKKFTATIKRLIKGQDVTMQEYTFNNKFKKPKQLTFIAAPVIVVEGLFVYHHPTLKSLLDLKIYIEAKENLKVIRRIRRDQIERNLPLDMVLYQYENHVLPAFENFILPHKDEVDIIINNNKSFDPSLHLMTGFIDHQLHKK